MFIPGTIWPHFFLLDLFTYGWGGRVVHTTGINNTPHQQALFLDTSHDIHAIEISEKLSFCIFITEFSQNRSELCKKVI